MSDIGQDAGKVLRGQASGQGRVYQSASNQYITEHHHHYPAVEDSSFFEPSLLRTVVRTGQGPSWTDLPAPDSIRTPLVGRTPRVLRDRASLIRRLSAATDRELGGTHVLHGIGGCGKTAIAHALFNMATRDGRRVGLWVNASERATLRAGMLAVAADRGAEPTELVSAYAGQRAAADLVWHYLDHSPQPWVLVLDNADDPSVIEEGTWLRSSPQGTVVVTTRQGTSPVWAGAELHSVGVLPVEDAAHVLRDLAPESGTLEEAEATARRLDCLPLALTLAGSFLSSQLLESWSMTDYQRKLDENPTEVIDRGASSMGERNSRNLVGRTWQLSLSALERAGVPECVTLMRLLSCWSSDPVPLSLLHPHAAAAADLSTLDPPLPGDRMEIALRGLLDHSLVSIVNWQDEGDVVRCVQAHGVVLDSVHAAIPHDQQPLVVAAAGRLLGGAVPGLLRGVVAAPGIERLAPHAVKLLTQIQDPDSARTAVDVASRLAGHILNSGDYQAALFLGQSAAKTAEDLLGPDDPAGFRAHHQVAVALFRLGRFEESEALHRQVLEGRRRILGPEDTETLESLQDIFAPLGLLGRLEECIQALKDTEEIRTRVLGVDHSDTLHARALLIEFLAALDEPGEFDRIGPSTVAACEEILGADSFTTVTARHNYAYGLYRFGRWERAEEAARLALSDRERLHGAEHPLALSAAILLSWILEKRGLFAEAIVYGRRVVSGQERALGPDHPYVLENRTSLATCLAAAGDRVEAESLAGRNLPLCERVLGVSNAVTLRTRRLMDDLQGNGAATSPLGQDGGPDERA